MVKTKWERIGEAFYTIKNSGEQGIILLSDETVNLFLKSSRVNFINGDLMFEKCNEEIVVGIDSSRLAGPHAYVRTFNKQYTCAKPRIDVSGIPAITI